MKKQTTPAPKGTAKRAPRQAVQKKETTNCIVIPSYWSASGIDSWKTFDHPPPIEEDGTLRRTLLNLAEMKPGVPVILFPAPTDPRIEQKVRDLSAGIDLDIHVFSAADMRRVKKCLREAAAPKAFTDAVHMKSYGAIRNMGLIFAALKGYENVIQIDDDELIEDPQYMEKALAPIGQKVDGQTVLGTTGFYLDENNKAYYDGQMEFTFKNWPKDELFNKEVKHNITKGATIHPATCAFGGNMVINRKMFLKVSYDPWGTRGEDDDYIYNAMNKGMLYFFTQNSWVKHLPPKRKKAYWTRHRQDIIRFKYLREKARAYKLTPEQLGIFNGTFVQADFEFRAVSSAISAARHFLDRDRSEFEEFLNNAVLAVELSVEGLQANLAQSLAFQKQWSVLMPKIENKW